VEEISGIMKDAVLLCTTVHIAILSPLTDLLPLLWVRGLYRFWVWKSVHWRLLQIVGFKVVIIDRFHKGQKLIYFGFCIPTQSSGTGLLFECHYLCWEQIRNMKKKKKITTKPEKQAN